MTRNITTLLFIGIIIFTFSTGVSVECNAGSIFRKAVSKAIARKTARKSAFRSARKKAARKSYAKILRRDALRDNKTKAVALKKSRFVNRYTNKKQALLAKKHGLPAKSHMTSGARRGRPIKARTAKERYGLWNKPTVRMKIKVPKGQPVRKNKVIGGKPGYGEWTSTKKIPGGNIISIHKIK